MSDRVSDPDGLNDLRDLEKGEADQVQIEEFIIDVEEKLDEGMEADMEWQ